MGYRFYVLLLPCVLHPHCTCLVVALTLLRTSAVVISNSQSHTGFTLACEELVAIKSMLVVKRFSGVLKLPETIYACYCVTAIMLEVTFYDVCRLKDAAVCLSLHLCFDFIQIYLL